MGLKDQLKRKKALTDDHFVPADDEQAEDFARAQRDLSLAGFAGDEERIEEAKARLEAVKEAIKADGVHFHIVSVGRVRFEELMREHPPTDEQKAKFQASYNADTLWPVLLSESVNPGEMTPAEWVKDFLESPEWGAGEIAAVREKVMAVNTGTRVAELGN